jgi:putative spermidine/putrescine transport system permease protein
MLGSKRSNGRSLSFYILAGFFAAFVVFQYGPMLTIYILSFQGPHGGLTLPMNGVSLHWFRALMGPQRTGDFVGPFIRSFILGLIVLVVTVVVSVMAGLAFRRRFFGANLIFYAAVASLIMPGLLIGLGVGLMFQIAGVQPAWWSSALGAQLTWTLPFGLLIMFAVLSRVSRSYEEAARDLGASGWQVFRHVLLPILSPGIIAVAVFAFTLSYDEFPRSLLTVGSQNTLPLEIWAMTTNVTSPALYAVGTVTTFISFIFIVLAISLILAIERRRLHRAPTGQSGLH